MMSYDDGRLLDRIVGRKRSSPADREREERADDTVHESDESTRWERIYGEPVHERVQQLKLERIYGEPQHLPCVGKEFRYSLAPARTEWYRKLYDEEPGPSRKTVQQPSPSG